MSDTRPVSPNYKWQVVGMLWFMAFFNYADRQAITTVFPLIQAEMGLSKVEIGYIGASFAWVYGLAAPFAGMVVDRVRRKTAILGGLFAWSIICMATALSRDFKHLMFFRAAEGLGESFYFPASMSLVSDYHGKDTRSRAMALHQTSVYIGSIAGGVFSGLIGQYYGWRSSFIIFGALGVFLGLLLMNKLREPHRGAADLKDAGAADEHVLPKMKFSHFLQILWTTPTVLMLLGAFLCANFVAAILLIWMPTYLTEKFGFSLAGAGLGATAFVQIASMFSVVLGGYLADKFRHRTTRGRMFVQMIGLLCGAPFIVLCGMTTQVTWLLVALTAWGFFKGMYDANIFASVFDVVRPEARGTVAGFMNCIGWLGGAGTAPIIVGYVAEKYSLGTAIALGSIVYLFGVVLLIIGMVFFVKRDAERMQAELLAETA